MRSPVDFGKDFYDEDDGFYQTLMGATPLRTTTIDWKRKEIDIKAAARTKLHADAIVRERSTIDKGSFPSARKKHERELNVRGRSRREEFELEAEKRREKKEKEDETKHREETNEDDKATAFKNTTGEREALKKENDKRREEKRAKTERILKQKLATERRSRWRRRKLCAQADEVADHAGGPGKEIEKALNRPERMY